MADRSITWQRTGGKTHRVVVNDGKALSLFGVFRQQQALWPTQPNVLRANAQVQWNLQSALNYQDCNQQANILGAFGSLGGLFG